MKTLRTLSAAERNTYDEQGFVCIPDVFPTQECQAINAEIDRLVIEECRRRGVEPSPKTWLMRLGRRSPLTHRITHDERLLTLIEDIVNPGISIYSAKLVPKAPGETGVCHWHQDDAYYIENQESSCRMSIWLALQDSDETNGGVHFIPGSHRLGLQDIEEKQSGFCTRAIKEVPKEMIAQAVCPPVKAGSVVLFDAHTWHYSGPNTTDRLRRSFIVSYQEGTCSGGNGDQFEVVRPVGH